uniref:hypothetical protein n=1 Tax=uncultured Draconibacterium sp. TaxID=1573823 RepID=UPI003216DF0A
MKLRIHHFFDIIRDLGSGKEITPHPYGHAYHTVAEKILNEPGLEYKLVECSDAICSGCTHLVNGICDDVITHRSDFESKEAFNNHLDNRIMSVCGFLENKTYSPRLLCKLAQRYLDNIGYIYEGNDELHTKARKASVEKGLRFYAEKHMV